MNPPLARMVAAAPLLAQRPALDAPAGTPLWGIGYLFMQQNVERYQALFVTGGP
jgi:hypothetical protein